MPGKERLIPIFIVVFVDILGFSLILPLLPFYARELNAADTLVGPLIASYSLCQFIAAPILGNLSDTYGRRPILLYSQFGSFLGFILLGLAMHLPHPLAWLFAGRMIDGLSGGNLTVAQAYISDITEQRERAKIFGMIIGVSFGLGFTIGPGLGGIISSRFGYDITAYLAAFFSLSSIIATSLLLRETQRQSDEPRLRGLAMYTRVVDYLRIVDLRPLLAVFFFMSLPFTIYTTMFPLFAKNQLGFDVMHAGYFLALVGLLGVIWQGGLIGPIVKRFGEYKSLMVGLVASAAGLYYITAVDVWWKLIFVAILFSFGHSVSRPSLTSLIAQAAPPDRRGGVFGAMTSIESMSRIIGPLLGGWIITTQPKWVGWVGGALFTVAALIGAAIRSGEARLARAVNSE
ncbi:MAG TPA: MFS transporter [Blastocatellia bacterium]|nr:MFS transporter [Blastocatellia bacterium]